MEVCHHRHKLPAVCLPCVLKELQLLKKKKHPLYWKSEKTINMITVYWLLDTAFICDDFILQFTREIVSRNDYFYDLKIFITLMFSRTSVIFLARKLKLAHQEV